MDILVVRAILAQVVRLGSSVMGSTLSPYHPNQGLVGSGERPVGMLEGCERGTRLADSEVTDRIPLLQFEFDQSPAFWRLGMRGIC